MTASLQRILFAIAAGLIAVDLIWGIAGHFHVDVAAYARLAGLSLALIGAGVFYQARRREPSIAAMLLGASFLCAFSAAASLLNYFLLTFHGPRIDSALAAADRALGFDWPQVMAAMGEHPLFNRLLFLVYSIVLPEIALIIVALGWRGNADKIYRFCIAVAVGALLCILVWALAPSFGAMSVYHLAPGVAAAVPVSVDGEYGRALAAMLRDGPGFISPADLRGLIGFPSYHGALALIVVWYTRGLPRLFWPLALLNGLVLVATPVQGGHHLVDVLAGFPVAALAIFASRACANAKNAGKPSRMVNETPNLTIRPVPKGLLRIIPAHKNETTSPPIKSKLSGVS